jgi:hypothetical protein
MTAWKSAFSTRWGGQQYQKSVNMRYTATPLRPNSPKQCTQQ